MSDGGDGGGRGGDRRIALLIDADNVSHAKIGAIVAELSKYGIANIRRAYGDWTAPGLKAWKDRLHEFAVRPIQQFGYSPGKNATDIALVIDAMELLYTQDLDAFALVSSDADFTPLVMQLKANGHDVFGFGERKAPAPFVSACTTFLYLDSLEDLSATPKAPAKAEVAKEETGKGKILSQDTALVNLLRGAVAAAAREDGWALMAAAGSAAKRQGPVEPRNYGVRNFAALFEVIGLFDIRKLPGGQSFVADKRNKERAAEPATAKPEGPATA